MSSTPLTLVDVISTWKVRESLAPSGSVAVMVTCASPTPLVAGTRVT
ncbi:MAG: hypothetical protein IPN77_14415 [Sandaracinaceae bacterium]|nr:hypothetical protein [Sandaracinaceae bacterium]